MARVSRARIQEFLHRGDRARTRTEQGQALEDLICYLFEKIPGISVTQRNPLNAFHAEEIDVAFWNTKHSRGLYFLPYIILVECKNWSGPVTSQEVGWFDTKLRTRGLTFGILVAANGITGDPVHLTSAHSIVARALSEQRRMVVITREEIETITDTGQMMNLLQTKLLLLAATGTCFS